MLETLEVQWCTLGLQRGMSLPCLQNFSASILMNPPDCDLRQEIGPYLESVNILILILEYNVYELIPDELEPRNINDIYGILEERENPPQACLIKGHVVAPLTKYKWMRFLFRAKRPADSDWTVQKNFEHNHRKKRQQLLQQLNIEDEFETPVDQEGYLR